MVKRNNSDFYLISLRGHVLCLPHPYIRYSIAKNILKDRETGTHFHDAGVTDEAQ